MQRRPHQGDQVKEALNRALAGASTRGLILRAIYRFE